MDDPSPAPQAHVKKFWTGPKIAAAVVAAWLFLMVFGSGGGNEEIVASDAVSGDIAPEAVVIQPDGSMDASVEPTPEETGPSAEDIIETELGNSVVY